MGGKLFAFVVIVMVAVGSGWAQQQSSTDSGGAKPQPASSPQSNSSGPGQGAATKPAGSTPSNPGSSLPNGMSDDLTFPESDPPEPPPSSKASHLAPPRSDRTQVGDLAPGVGDSSSKDTQVDLSPPADDAKVHPQSSVAVADAEAEVLSGNGVSEFHTWDPHKAAKSVEVGDFYFKRKNYRAAEARYREALRYKDNDAVATIRLAVCLEKLGILDDARAEYESYLKILPHGPQAPEVRKAIDRLNQETTGAKAP